MKRYIKTKFLYKEFKYGCWYHFYRTLGFHLRGIILEYNDEP